MRPGPITENPRHKGSAQPKENRHLGPLTTGLLSSGCRTHQRPIEISFFAHLHTRTR